LINKKKPVVTRYFDDTNVNCTHSQTKRSYLATYKQHIFSKKHNCLKIQYGCNLRCRKKKNSKYCLVMFTTGFILLIN